MPAGRFAGGLALVEYLQRHRGIINKACQSVFDNRPVDWEGISVVHDGLILVTSGVSTPFGNGYFDTTGKLVAKYACGLKFDAADYFSEGWAAVKLGYGWGYIDRHGVTVSSLGYDGAEHFQTAVGWFDTNISMAMWIRVAS